MNYLKIHLLLQYLPRKVPYHILRSRNGTELFWGAICTLLAILLTASSALSAPPAQSEPLIDYPSNQDYGQQGDFIAKRAVDAGRSAIMSTIGPALILLPESPGSSDAHVTLQTWDSSWDLSNPLDPQFVRYVNCFEGTCRNGQAQHAHATHTDFWEGEAYLWTNNHWELGNSHTYDPLSGDTVAASPYWEISAGRLYSPFYMDDLWSYNVPFSAAQTIYYPLLSGDDWRGLPIATWDHLGTTGVTGFFSFHGELMVIASDQASSGMAIYSMNGWKEGLTSNTFTPQLLSVFQPSLTEPDGNPIGLGGYWAEPYGANKMVWAARPNSSFGRNYPGIYVVDFTDPATPELTCELYFDQDTSDPTDGDNMTLPMYVNYQDQYAYVDHMKVDITACETLYKVGKAADPNYMISSSEMSQIAYKFPTTQNYCDGSQYFRPLGQIGVFGGYDNFGTEAIMTYEGPTIEAGNSSYSTGVYVSYDFGLDSAGLNRAMVGANSLAPGDTLNGGRTIISIERDERVNTQGICFFVTSDVADENPPYVSGHRPLANQTNVARDTFISLHIPETMRSETVVNAFQLTRTDTGAAVAFQHRLSHTGTVTLWPAADLEADVMYRVDVSGIQDYMGNTMTPYSFLFATGNELDGPEPTATPESTDTPTPEPTDTSTLPPEPTTTVTLTHTPTPAMTAIPTLTVTSTITPTVTPTVMPTAAPTITPTVAPTVMPTATPTVIPTPQSGWIPCALEHEICLVPDTALEAVVRYGADGSYAYQENVTGSIACSNDIFGDSLVGTFKACAYWSGTPSPDYAGDPYYPNQSSQISCRAEAESDNVWVVNPDNHSVTIIDTYLAPGSREVALRSQREAFFSYRTPTSITRIGDLYAVTYRDDDKVLFLQAATANPIFTIDTGHGTQPVASITGGTTLFVALFGSGEVIAIDPDRRAITDRLAVGPMPKAMALFDNRLLVTRFISSAQNGEVYDIDTTSGLALTRTIMVNKVLVNDDLDHGSGVPNFLSSIVINRDGSEAMISAVKANVDRGSSAARSGIALDDDNTVRPMLARIDLINHRDANIVPLSPAGTVDLDNAADPAGITFLVDGETQLITLQGNNVVLARNERLNTFAQFSSGFAPQEMCTTLRTAYVKNFTDRTVSAIDIAGYLAEGNRNPAILSINTVEDELLTVQELDGLRQFYQSSIPQMGAEGYMSCASCHRDGGQDGQVWDMTSLGEGLRNTISLNGSSGTRFGNLHWTANFDEVQDFELQIEELNGGEGLIAGQTFNGESPLDMVTSNQSSELDALAAYVASLGKESVKRSPYRTYTGNLTDAALRGQQIFESEGCTTCHAGQAFRNGQMHNVGTITAASGDRLFGELNRIRTPTLIELWESAPYFHDGSAATLNDVLDRGAHRRTFRGTEEADLIEFLLSIDQDLFIDDDTAYPDFE